MLLTVDLGTSVTKVALWGEQGAVTAGRSKMMVKARDSAGTAVSGSVNLS